MKNSIRRLLAGGARNERLYSSLLRYVERYGLFIEREREWLKWTPAVQHTDVVDRILADLKVLHGPFQGMSYPAQQAMGSALFPKLLGSYECELHPLLEEAISAPYDDIVDIGCAEGYYAVGLATRLPKAQVWAFDTDDLALSACREMGQLNGVKDRLGLGQFCGPAELTKIPFSGRALIISDCEGFEKALFTPAVCQQLAGHDVLIEVHDFRDPSISKALRAAFAATHDISVTRAIPDRLRADLFRYDELSGLNWETRTTLLAEVRPASMEWFFCRSRLNRS